MRKRRSCFGSADGLSMWRSSAIDLSSVTDLLFSSAMSTGQIGCSDVATEPEDASGGAEGGASVDAASEGGMKSVTRLTRCEERRRVGGGPRSGRREGGGQGRSAQMSL